MFNIASIKKNIVIQHPTEDDVFFHFRPLTDEDNSALRDLHTSEVLGNDGTTTVKKDNQAIQRDLFLKRLVKWEGMFDGEKAYKCTEANKKEFYNYCWLNEVRYLIEKLNEHDMEKLEKDLGNLTSTSTSEPTKVDG